MASPLWDGNGDYTILDLPKGKPYNLLTLIRSNVSQMCYTRDGMQTETDLGTRSSWSRWAGFLRQHRLENLAVWAIEAFGPLAVMGAALLHAGSPLLRPSLSTAQVDSLASLLEDPSEMRAFTAYLREDSSP
jgi:hypothetical protein